MTLSIAALLLAVGKFIDTYHNRSGFAQKATALARDLLVRLYFFLSDVKPSQIAKPAIRIVLKIRYVFYVGLVLMTALVWIGLAGIAFLWGNVMIPWDWSLLIISIGLVVLFLIFTTLRVCATHLSDGSTSLVILIMAPLFLYFGLEIIGIVSNNIPNLVGFYFALSAVATYVIACAPISVLLLVFLLIVVLKYLTLLLRWLGLHISEASSDPKNDPFTYFSALSAVLVLAAKTLSEVL
ncbi:MAG: hypothetical protein Q8K52_10785 [Thiobacillus sp.]|nr:hypothetical protein [Thiobacillus sp.]